MDRVLPAWMEDSALTEMDATSVGVYQDTVETTVRLTMVSEISYIIVVFLLLSLLHVMFLLLLSCWYCYCHVISLLLLSYYCCYCCCPVVSQRRKELSLLTNLGSIHTLSSFLYSPWISASDNQSTNAWIFQSSFPSHFQLPSWGCTYPSDHMVLQWSTTLCPSDPNVQLWCHTWKEGHIFLHCC